MKKDKDNRFSRRYIDDLYGTDLDNGGAFVEHFTTPSGDRMVAFGMYGYDG